MADSRDIARVFGREHKTVLAGIRALDCSPEFHRQNFLPMTVDVEVGNGAVRQSPSFLMTKDGFTFLVMGFTGKEAAWFKEAYIAKFNAMEAELLAMAQERGEVAGHGGGRNFNVPEQNVEAPATAAKRRLADEYDAAQERGEIEKPGGNRTSIVPNENNAPAKVEDLGLTRKDIHEARPSAGEGDAGAWEVYRLDRSRVRVDRSSCSQLHEDCGGLRRKSEGAFRFVFRSADCLGRPVHARRSSRRR